MAATEAVGHGITSFLWSEQEYEPRDLFERFGHLFPFVAMVTQGYCGKDEPIHMFASEEMYWLRDVAFQKRVVCRDTSKDYYSIPLCYPERVTPSQSNGVDGPMMTIEEMMSESKYRFFTFEAGCCHSITKNADILQNKVLGTLEITENYDERFLIVHTLLSEAYHEPPTDQYPRGFYNTAGVLSNCTVIPLYMPIALAVAVGMSETETENFRRTMHDFREFVDTLPKDYDEILKGVSDIMAFEEAPSGGDYEYIHFLQFIRANREMKNISSDGYWAISNVPDSSPKPELPQRRPAVTGAESVPAPKRPPKRGESKGSTIVTKLFKKNTTNKASTNMLPFPKERAPSPTSDSNDSSDDSLQYEEIVANESTAYEQPVTTSATLIPTPIAYREGHVALGVDPKPILTELNHMFSNGIIPKSTKLAAAKKEKVVMQPDYAAKGLVPLGNNNAKQADLDQPPKRQRGPYSSVSASNSDDGHPTKCSSHEAKPQSVDRNECKQVDMDQPPRPKRAPMRSASTPNDDENHHAILYPHKAKSQSLHRSRCSQETTVKNRSLPPVPKASVSPVLKAEPFQISEMLSTKQSLKRADKTAVVEATGSYPNRKEEHTDDKTKPSASEQFANENRLGTSLGVRPQQKQTGILNQETQPKTYEDRVPKESTITDLSTQDELGNDLKQQRQIISGRPVAEKRTFAGKKETTIMAADENLEIVGSKESSVTTRGQDTHGTVPVKPRHVPVQGINLAVIQPKVKKKPTVNAKATNSQLGMKPVQTSEKMQHTDSSDVKKSKYVLKVLSDDIVSGADIPQDVSKFTVGDVARCLELLNMSDYVDQFIAQQIDGAFLQCISANMLQDEFGMNSLMATKLVMFAKEGWRPNV